MSRRAIQRYVEKYLFNPGMRTAIRLGCAPRIFALLETTGRRTGQTRRTPVTVATDGDVAWLVAEHGWGCGYVRNISAEPRVRLKIGRHWHTGPCWCPRTTRGVGAPPSTATTAGWAFSTASSSRS